MIQEYMDAMEGGIETTLKWIDKSKTSDSSVKDGICNVFKNQYTDLDQPYETEPEEYFSTPAIDTFFFPKQIQVIFRSLVKSAGILNREDNYQINEIMP